MGESERCFPGLRTEAAGVSMYAPVTLGVGSDRGSILMGLGVSSIFSSLPGASASVGEVAVTGDGTAAAAAGAGDGDGERERDGT